MVSHVLQMVMKYAIIHESEESISYLCEISNSRHELSRMMIFKKNKKRTATKMAQISFPTLNAHKNRTNCAIVHQGKAKTLVKDESLH